MKKGILFLILLFTSSCQRPFLKVVSSSFAKEFCSCHFVVGQSKDYCEKYAKQIIPVSKYQIDGEKKVITANGLGHSTSVLYRNTRLGCRIVND
ncbi:MAG: hypothetical protein K9K67_04160 [Bacteriovoracaceae bacterium]|nr:hypothetical protein [Bacteriovoracaceae bacterium]